MNHSQSTPATSPLVGLDETLCHQTPAPFGIVHTSDHRFFDRNWFGCFSPDGRVGVITGMGAYANMNAFDCFATVQADGKQHNVRAARPLRPEVQRLGAGPVRHEVVEPLRAHRLVLEPGDHPCSFDLLWEGGLSPHVEPRHVGVLDGRTYEDYTRFDQTGQVSGWVRIGDDQIDAEGWFGARDHSWGVRRSTGGFEPFTGSLPGELLEGVLFIWAEFATDDGGGGHVQVVENGAGVRQVLHGFLVAPDGTVTGIVDVGHDIDFHPGSRRYRHMSLRLVDEAGASHTLEADPALTAWAYVGTGYDGGFDDKRGLGAHRAACVEFDTYDVSHHENVVLPDGSVVQPLHREQPARITLDGVDGSGHMPVIAVGPNQRYGL